MNDQQLVNLLHQVGFRGQALKTAFGVAKRESGGRPEAFNPDRSTGDQSYGLFQINMIDELGPARRKQFGLGANEDLFDPLTNAKVAYRMSGGGKNWEPWTTYTSGLYKDAAAQAPKPNGKGVGKLTPRAPTRPGFRTKEITIKGPPGVATTRSEITGGGIDPMALAQSMLSGLPMSKAISESISPFAFEDVTTPAPPTPSRTVQVKVPVPGKPRSARTVPGGGVPRPGGKGGIRELFYDPLGAYDEGNWISPIGGHSDHVHVSFGDRQAAVQAIKLAKRMGLRASENPYAEHSAPEPGVHTPSSYHYQMFPGQVGGYQVGKGLDVSGPSDLMSKYFKKIKGRI